MAPGGGITSPRAEVGLGERSIGIKRRRAYLIGALATLALAEPATLALDGAEASDAYALPQVSMVAEATTDSTAADALRETYTGLRTQLEQSPFQRPLHLESAVESRSSQGDVYAVVDYPMSRLSGSLTNPDNWCEVLMLHVNVKSCRVDPGDENPVLRVAIGRKYDQPSKKAYPVEFTFCVTSSGDDYMSVVLDAGEGPFGTRDYRIALEAVALEGDRVLLHLRYSLNYGFQARVALKTYLATSGSGKVGFTMVAPHTDRPPRLVRGMRGAVERNVMRYYLAIEAYLAALPLPEPERFERSLALWFDATEMYSAQLHELDREDYLAMKRVERERQQALQ